MRIIWTELAKYKLKEAFQYYKEVAGINVANSIKKKIYQKTRKLSRFPEIGQKEANPAAGSYDYHYVVSGHYKIVYRVIKNEKIILISTLFDTRQDPEQLVL